MISECNKGKRQITKIDSEKNVRVKMRDGASLAVDIYKPHNEGKFPALLAISPYGKEMQAIQLPPQPYASSLCVGSIEAGDTAFIVANGYAHVIADVRGTGHSDGEFEGIYSTQEPKDGYDLVEWVARQPWCDGNVGMIGISYFGVSQFMIAAEQPPHLKAIFPYDANNDRYRDGTYDGGILSSFYHSLYNIQICGTNAVSSSLKRLLPAKVKKQIHEVLKDPDMAQNPFYYRILKDPRRNPGFFDILLHPLDGPFYWERSPYTTFDKIKIPTYLGSGWYAYAFTHLPGAFRAYANIDAPKKLLIGPPQFLERPFHDYHDVIIKWYDHWLKGENTGIMDEPPIRIWIMGANTWRYENEWPLKRTKWTKYYLRSWERLSPEPEIYYDEPDCFVQQPPTMTTTIQSVKYLSKPFSEDTEITGPIALYIYASIDNDDTNWIVALYDLDEYGGETELTRGWLKASHRAIDKAKSKDWQPYHPHTERIPIKPGEVNEYAIEIRPTSNLFKPGHRIKLEISCLDLPIPPVRGPRPHHLGISKTILHKIYRNGNYQSYLLLPIIQK